jgi:hypothetical protein
MYTKLESAIIDIEDVVNEINETVDMLHDLDITLTSLHEALEDEPSDEELLCELDYFIGEKNDAAQTIKELLINIKETADSLIPKVDWEDIRQEALKNATAI